MRRFRAVMLAVGAIAVAAAAGRWTWRERDRLPRIENVLARARDVVAPGPLAHAHREVPELADCAACHSTTDSIADEKCLACHAAIGERRANRSGFHGASLEGDCATCHVDHRDPLISFDRSTFQHDLARFTLRGAHADLACEACHTRPRDDSEIGPIAFHYLRGESDSCGSCHVSPHLDASFARDVDCDRCHGDASSDWSIDPRRFDHEHITGFALDAAHAPLDCTACHSIPRFAKTPRACADCHVEVASALAGRIEIGGASRQFTPSPHDGIVSCDRCHDGARRDESALDFAAKCADCHSERYADLFHQQRAHLARSLSVRHADANDAASRVILDAIARFGDHDFTGACEALDPKSMAK